MVVSICFIGNLSTLKDKPVTIKEGTPYKLKITFQVSLLKFLMFNVELNVKVILILNFCFPFN